ncbi:type I polyketide synthase [Streptomyces niveus]|uniref:type I polyketide synthase n=1 Tax=Streptomyces niveus TaxID=193462 RepID=UPI00133139B3|nr:type I polyketide synthase [Streptomyces niveus]
MNETYRDAPIAIVGMGLRFPGSNSTPRKFAKFLREGRSGITELPAGRLGQGVPDDVQTDAGYLDTLEEFDAGFFNISPREAAFVDPQHRLTLETAWEALEDSGIDPTSLRHGDTGVYVAVTGMDYAMEIARLPTDQVELYAGTGMFHCGASGRVSYFLGLRGPSMSVDGACASSLVAVHLAVQGLRMGECGVALCGAANTISDPAYPVMASRSGVLAGDARCKTFDDAADGYVRGEGVAMIVLKRLDDARRAGDRILAVIRGSAVRQDGESAALMAPNGKAQALLMRAALKNAGLTAADIQYVEAHGTGTALGDPIEIAGITEVFSGSHSTQNPVIVGSVKTNLGHLESTAGMAGLIKTVSQLRDGTIYPHLNYTTPSRKIPWDRVPVKVPVELTPWTGGTRRALVNSYGATGTIASVVLEEAGAEAAGDTDNGEADTSAVFTLSAKTANSLRRQLDAYAEFMTGKTDLDLADVCYTSNVARAHHAWRVSASVSSASDLTQFIERQRTQIERLRSTSGRKNVALMFSGGGSQYAGMGRSLYQRIPVFRQHIDKCGDLFAPLVGHSLREEILGDIYEGSIPTGAGVLTARLFSLQYALAKLWLSVGVRPTALIGHSLGEIVAATVAGIFTLEDAVRLVAFRGELLDKTSAGSMAAVEASRDEMARILESYPDTSLGAVNGLNKCVISGGSDSVAEIVTLLQARGTKVKHLRVPVASHSPLMDEIADSYRAELEKLRFGKPEFAIASTVLGKMAQPGDMTTPDYWMRHLRDTVNFSEAMRAIEGRGQHVFLEVGPGAELIGMGRECAGDRGHLWLGSMHRNDPSGNTTQLSVSRLYGAGLPIDWSAWHSGARGTRVPLPLYAFDRKPYWLPAPATDTGIDPSDQFHPLLGAEISDKADRAAGTRTFESSISSTQPAYLAEHDLNGTPVFPGTGFIEMLLAVQDALFGETTRPIEGLKFHEPLFFSENPVGLRTRVHQESDRSLSVDIISRLGSAEQSVDRLHVSARIGSGVKGVVRSGPRTTADRLRSGPTPSEVAELSLTTADLSAYFRQHGAGYGPTFRTLRQATRYAGATVVGEIEGRRAAPGDILHPALLAGALQSAAGLFKDRLGDDVAFIASGSDEAQLFRKPRGRSLRSVLRVVHSEEEHITADLALFDEDDNAVFCMTGLSFQRVSTAPPGLGAGTSAARAQGEEERSSESGTFDVREWNELPDEQRRKSASAFLLVRVADLLHFQDPGEIPDGASFFELGMDSLITVRLKNVVENAFRIPLEVRTIFDNPTIDALAEVLVTKASAGLSKNRA